MEPEGIEKEWGGAGREREKEIWRCHAGGFEDKGKVHKPKNLGSL